MDRRDKLQQHLNQNDVGTAIYYPVGLHQQKCFAHFGHDAAAFPESTRASQETLAIPIDPELTGEQLRCVAEEMAAFYAEY